MIIENLWKSLRSWHFEICSERCSSTETCLIIIKNLRKQSKIIKWRSVMRDVEITERCLNTFENHRKSCWNYGNMFEHHRKTSKIIKDHDSWRFIARNMLKLLKHVWTSSKNHWKASKILKKPSNSIKHYLSNGQIINFNRNKYRLSLKISNFIEYQQNFRFENDNERLRMYWIERLDPKRWFRALLWGSIDSKRETRKI